MSYLDKKKPFLDQRGDFWAKTGYLSFFEFRFFVTAILHGFHTFEKPSCKLERA